MRIDKWVPENPLQSRSRQRKSRTHKARNQHAGYANEFDDAPNRFRDAVASGPDSDPAKCQCKNVRESHGKSPHGERGDNRSGQKRKHSGVNGEKRPRPSTRHSTCQPSWGAGLDLSHARIARAAALRQRARRRRPGRSGYLGRGLVFGADRNRTFRYCRHYA